jgi:outer membrane lipoprotein-sorting protein
MGGQMKRLILLLALSTLAQADKLDDILTKMDAAAAGFTGISASISYTKVTVIVDDKDVRNGGIHLEKEKGEYKIKIEFTAPEAESLLLKGGDVQIYHPKIDQMEVYKAGKDKGTIEQFFAVGFGGGGHAILKSYAVALGADEKIGDTMAVKLNLTPKTQMPGNFVKVEIWLNPAKWTPVQQRFTEKSKDYLEITYSSVLDGKQPESVFNIKTTKRTKTVFPGKS